MTPARLVPLVLAGLAACARPPHPTADVMPGATPMPTPVEPAPAAPVGVRQVVGELLPEGVMRCTATGERTWVSPHHVLGLTPLAPAPGVDLAPFELGLVVVTGAVEPRGLQLPPAPAGAECPPAQMRSDWIESKTGIRIARAGMGAIGPAFRVDAVARFDGLALALRDDALHVTLRNTFDHPLADVVVTVHYEGCYGKPGSAAERATVPTLAPGAELAHDFPRLVERDRGRPGLSMHRAFSVQVQARSPSVAFDFDRRLSRAGVAVDCPER